MYRKNTVHRTSLRVNTSVEGETIEQKVERIVNNKEPITDGAPLLYSERSEGVVAGYDIRTDRWEIAADAMDAVSRDKQAKRDARVVKMNKDDGGAEPTHGQAQPPKGD